MLKYQTFQANSSSTLMSPCLKLLQASCGRTLLYIKDTLKYICRNDLQIHKAGELESTFIELLSSSGKNIIVGCIYRYPSMLSSEFNSIYLNDLEKLSHENKNILIGDFTFFRFLRCYVC